MARLPQADGASAPPVPEPGGASDVGGHLGSTAEEALAQCCLLVSLPRPASTARRARLVETLAAAEERCRQAAEEGVKKVPTGAELDISDDEEPLELDIESRVRRYTRLKRRLDNDRLDLEDVMVDYEGCRKREVTNLQKLDQSLYNSERREKELLARLGQLTEEKGTGSLTSLKEERENGWALQQVQAMSRYKDRVESRVQLLMDHLVTLLSRGKCDTRAMLAKLGDIGEEHCDQCAERQQFFLQQLEEIRRVNREHAQTLSDAQVKTTSTHEKMCAAWIRHLECSFCPSSSGSTEKALGASKSTASLPATERVVLADQQARSMWLSTRSRRLESEPWQLECTVLTQGGPTSPRGSPRRNGLLRDHLEGTPRTSSTPSPASSTRKEEESPKESLHRDPSSHLADVPLTLATDVEVIVKARGMEGDAAAGPREVPPAEGPSAKVQLAQDELPTPPQRSAAEASPVIFRTPVPTCGEPEGEPPATPIGGLPPGSMQGTVQRWASEPVGVRSVLRQRASRASSPAASPMYCQQQSLGAPTGTGYLAQSRSSPLVAANPGLETSHEGVRSLRPGCMEPQQRGPPTARTRRGGSAVVSDVTRQGNSSSPGTNAGTRAILPNLGVRARSVEKSVHQRGLSHSPSSTSPPPVSSRTAPSPRAVALAPRMLSSPLTWAEPARSSSTSSPSVIRSSSTSSPSVVTGRMRQSTPRGVSANASGGSKPAVSTAMQVPASSSTYGGANARSFTPPPVALIRDSCCVVGGCGWRSVSIPVRSSANQAAVWGNGRMALDGRSASPAGKPCRR